MVQVHLPQFPRDMGRRDKIGSRDGQTLALTVGAGGGASYDAVVKQQQNRDKWVATDHSALVPKLDSLQDEVILLVLSKLPPPVSFTL
jgi:SNW domain-containing protein 1